MIEQIRKWLATPVAPKFNRRSSAAGLYILSAIVLAWSAGCDVSPAAGALSKLYAQRQQVHEADACVAGRLAEVPAFEVRGQALEAQLHPYVASDNEAVFFSKEHALRDKQQSVAFVHIEVPRPIEQVNAGTYGVHATPDPELGPLAVGSVESVADGCLVTVLPAPAAPRDDGTAEPSPVPSAFFGEATELEVRGSTDATVALTRDITSIPVALAADQLSFGVAREGDNGKRVLDSKTRVILFCIATPSPAPTMDPVLLGGTPVPSPTPTPLASAKPQSTPTPEPVPTARGGTPAPKPGATPCGR